MARAVLAALWAHWWHHKLQLGAVVMGLALATALWSGVQALNAEARASYARAAAMLGQDRLDSLARPDGQTFSQEVFVALRRAGWLASPVIEGRLGRGAEAVTLLGIDPVTMPVGAVPGAVQEQGGLSAFITPPGRAYVAPDTLARAQAVAGLPPLALAEGLAPGVVLVDIGIAQGLLGAPGQISRLMLAPVQPEGRAPLAKIAPMLERRAAGSSGDELAQMTGSFHLNLTAFGLLSFAVGLFIVHAAIGLAFEQRRATFRTLRALGVPLRALLAALAGEVLVLALLAGALGVALGYGVAALLLPDIAATIRGLYGAQVPGTLSLRPEWWAGGLAMALAGAALAGGQSLWRLAQMPVLAGALPRAWARASRRAMARQGAVAALLAGAALAVGLWGTGMLAGFVLLGALLLAAALALPAALAGLLALAGRGPRGALAQWFWADTRHQLPGLSLALMALLLALSANVGVGTMVASFRLTFTGWLDQRLAAEIYLTARNEAEAARLAPWLAPRVDAVLPIWNVEGPLGRGQEGGANGGSGQSGAGQGGTMPGTVFGVADHSTYSENWPLLRAVPDVWARLAAGEGVLVNEQFWRRAGLALGDPIALPGGATRPLVGVYSDYGNPQAQAMIGLDDLTRLYPDVERLRFGLRLPPDQVGALRTALEDEFGLPAGNMIDQAGIKALSLSIFERTFAVTAALNVLTLGVAGFAMFTSLLSLAGLRLPQLAPVWALGLTRAHLARLELLRALMLAGLTMVLAVPVGLVLAWVLLAVVNVAAFGWRLPMHVFPADWLGLMALALAAAGLAAAWPAWRLARLSPGELLKVFASER